MQHIKDKLIGTWKLSRFEIKNLTTNKSLAPYGHEPIGTLLFSADGYMSVAIMADGRKNFALESLQISSAEEKIAAIETYLSYSGKWRIENDQIYVNVLISLLPNWSGKEHFRTFQLAEETLTFQTPIMKQGEFEIMVELSWKKAD